jgi:glycosyltransferase involved in cell wall biosynthesis
VCSTLRSFDSPLRVLSVIDSLAQGGAERSLVELVEPLRRVGVELAIAVLAERDGLTAEAAAAGAPPLSLAGEGGLPGDVGRLRRVLRSTKPDLVHTTLWGANVVGRIGATIEGIPVVSSLVNTPYGPDHRATPEISPVRLRGAQFLDVVTAQVVRRFHANAEHVRTTMARRLAVSPGRIDVVPRGRSSEQLGRRTAERRESARRALGFGSERVVLVPAREEHQKGLDHAIDAVASLRGVTVRLVVAGREGNATEALRRRVERESLEDVVSFLGFRRDVPDLMVAADVVLLPSRREGFPGALVEALALEVPIVASDLPGVREVVGETGVLVDRPSGTAFASAVESVLDHPEAADRMAERGRRRFETRFTIEHTADEMAGFFRTALTGGAS